MTDKHSILFSKKKPITWFYQIVYIYKLYVLMFITYKSTYYGI